MVRILVIVIVAFTMGACTLARMATPTPLAGRSANFPVDLTRIPGNEKVVFGDWQTAKVERSWTTRLGAGIKFGGLAVVDEQADQPFAFELQRKQSEHRYVVKCVTRFSNREVEVGPVKLRKGTTRIHCLARDEKMDHEIKLAVMMVGTGHVGAMHVGTEWWKIETAHGLQNGHQIGTAAGYTIRREYAMLSAVQTINDRQVWLSKNLEPDLQPPIAIATTALLLYKPISSRSGGI